LSNTTYRAAGKLRASLGGNDPAPMDDYVWGIPCV